MEHPLKCDRCERKLPKLHNYMIDGNHHGHPWLICDRCKPILRDLLPQAEWTPTHEKE